jgi:hypothetical protein
VTEVPEQIDWECPAEDVLAVLEAALQEARG